MAHRIFLINIVVKNMLISGPMLAGYFAVRACNKNIRAGKERSKEASFGCESV